MKQIFSLLLFRLAKDHKDRGNGIVLGGMLVQVDTGIQVYGNEYNK